MTDSALQKIKWVRPADESLSTWARPTDDGLVESVRLLGVPVAPTASTAREEAIILLHAAAEIEHSLLVQYLYAAYSIQLDPKAFRGKHPPDAATGKKLVTQWRKAIRAVAVEEMGHLITVQNLLRVLRGGTPHFLRQQFPHRTSLYPFPFRLEPLTRQSLAKYTTAEMPALLPDFATFEELAIASHATKDVGSAINHVGVLYARIHFLFEAPDSLNSKTRQLAALFPAAHLDDKDFDFAGAAAYQFGPDDWNATQDILVLPLSNRADALAAICRIALQGEGPLPDGPCASTGPTESSHFEMFLQIYRQFCSSAGPRNWIPAINVPINPTTVLASQGRGRITNRVSRRVALVSNVRYWMMLAALWHASNLPNVSMTDSTTATRSDFIRWSKTAMKDIIGPLARLLTQLPRQHPKNEERAAAPFELPRQVSQLFPDPDSPQGWAIHTKLIDRYRKLVNDPIDIPPEHVDDWNAVLSAATSLDDEISKMLPKPIL